MITICAIPDPDRFFQMVDSCCGPVLLALPGAAGEDLRHNMVARSLLTGFGSGGYAGELPLELKDRRDVPRMLQYLMERCAG